MFIVLILAIPVTIGLWIASVHGQTTKVPAATCRAVAAALSDGPDPSADPVGYAEAQVLPLRQITTSDASLQTAIHQLSSAYESFYKSNGAAASSRLVHTADKSVDKFCPGVTS
jgi:tRNA U34 5-methylaminomethyl-2-thiouridine-forming methyltransferase MnmC